MAWADGDHTRHIFWLNGMAGTGKSTIARTVARKYHEEKRLGASFFFSRSGRDISHGDKLVATIAAQLAKNVPFIEESICEVIQNHKDIASQALRDQWNHLVLQPLSGLDARAIERPLLFVIDALDECASENNIRLVVQLFAEARSLRKSQLRIFLTSRPENPIRHSFDRIQETEHQALILHSIPQSIVDRDLCVFLKHQFQIITRESKLGSDWPNEQIIESLVDKSGGLFIWAATACSFIQEGKGFATKRLDKILRDDASSTPEEKLSQIYTVILQNSVNTEWDHEEKEQFYKLLNEILGSIVVLLSPFSANSLSRLLYPGADDVPKIHQVLDDMHSILEVPDDPDRPIRLHHPSFRDFLLNNQRCRDQHFWVHEEVVHRALATNCMRLMSDGLKEDICSLRAPGTLISEVESSWIERSLPSELQYACCYWIQHLQLAKARLYDYGEVHSFLRRHLLHWVEAMSLIGKTNDCIKMIVDLHSMVVSDMIGR
jgi:hypothetical protein